MNNFFVFLSRCILGIITIPSTVIVIAPLTFLVLGASGNLDEFVPMLLDFAFPWKLH